MENILYEHDYAEDHRKEVEESSGSLSEAVFDRAIDTGFFKAHSEAMLQIPKIINPLRKANYEYVRDICDRMAQRWGGKIRAEVRYDKWDAIIDLTLPFVEFGCPEELNDMKEIASRTDRVTFSAEGSWVRLHIFCYYFDDVASDEEKDEVFLDTLASHPALLKALLAEMESAGFDTTEYKEKFSDALSD